MLGPILITGGAGFIGSQLSAALVSSGCIVHVVDSLHPQVHSARGWPAGLSKRVNLMTGDIASPATWQAVFRLCQPEVIIHLAAETGTGQSLTAASRHGRTNVVGTTQMIDSLTQCELRPRHIVLASSRAVYGEGAWVDPEGHFYFPEARAHADLAAGKWEPVGPRGQRLRPLPNNVDSVPPRPASIYGATKLAQENILRAWCTAWECPLTILRLQNVYGPGQSLSNPYTGVLSLFAGLANRGEQIEVYEDGAMIRDFVHVSDVVSAFALVTLSPASSNRTLDIGSGTHTTMLSVAELIAQLRDAPPPVVTGKYRDGDVRAAFADIANAGVKLGYRPTVSLEHGLEGLAEWVEARP